MLLHGVQVYNVFLARPVSVKAHVDRHRQWLHFLVYFAEKEFHEIDLETSIVLDYEIYMNYETQAAGVIGYRFFRSRDFVSEEYCGEVRGRL